MWRKPGAARVQRGPQGRAGVQSNRTSAAPRGMCCACQRLLEVAIFFLPSHGLYDHGLFCASATHRDFTRDAATPAMPYLQRHCAVHLSWGWFCGRRPILAAPWSGATSPVTTDPTRRDLLPPPPLPALDQRRARLVQHQVAGVVEPLPHSPARFAPAPETEALQQGVRRTCWVGRGPPRQGARPPLVQHQTAGVVETLPHTLVRFAPAPVDGSSTKGSDTDPLAGRVGGVADK